VLDGADACPLVTGSANGCPDGDNDGVADTTDNCPTTSNANQADADGDGTGDACDADDDGDGVADATDNCPTTSNANQADADGDGTGDACDADDDGDGVADATDNCPAVANANQSDLDNDGIGDACDADDDGDGVADVDDACPTVSGTSNGCPAGGATIAQLIADVNALDISDALRRSLLAKLEAAQASLARGNTDAAKNQLNAFSNEVQAMRRSGRLSQAAADGLLQKSAGVSAAL
jgi:hypothetical protein